VLLIEGKSDQLHHWSAPHQTTTSTVTRCSTPPRCRLKPQMEARTLMRLSNNIVPVRTANPSIVIAGYRAGLYYATREAINAKTKHAVPGRSEVHSCLDNRRWKLRPHHRAIVRTKDPVTANYVRTVTR